MTPCKLVRRRRTRSLALAALVSAGCASAPPRAQAEECDNGADDDRDGRIDCRDADCTLAAVCSDGGPRDAAPDGGDSDADTDSDTGSGSPVDWGDRDGDRVPDAFDPDTETAQTVLIEEHFEEALEGWLADGLSKWGLTDEGQVVQTENCSFGYTAYGPESPVATNVYVEVTLELLPLGGPCGDVYGAGTFVRRDLRDLHACLLVTAKDGTTTLSLMRVEGDDGLISADRELLDAATVMRSLEGVPVRLGFVADGRRVACAVEGFDALWTESIDVTPTEGPLGLMTKQQAALFDDLLAVDLGG